MEQEGKKKNRFWKKHFPPFFVCPIFSTLRCTISSDMGRDIRGTPLDGISVAYATRLTDSLRHFLVKKGPSKESIKLLTEV